MKADVVSTKFTKFHEKILFDNGVINIQIPMTKYLWFQYSIISNKHGRPIFALEADAAMRYRNLRLTLTLTFADYGVLIKVLRQAKEFDAKNHRRNFQQARFVGSCKNVCIAAGFMTLAS